MHCERISSSNPSLAISSDRTIEKENPKKAIVNYLVLPLDTNAYDSYFYDLKDLLFSFSMEELEILSEIRDLLNPACINHYRFKIFQCLKGVALSEWTPLLNEWRKMMPSAARGHDLFWSMQILCGISKPSQREKIAALCANLFNEEMSSIERCYVLDGISKLDPVVLSNLDQSPKEIQVLYARTLVPDSIRKENEKAPYVP